MMANPRLNQPCRVRYRASRAKYMPYHDAVGKIVIVSRGKPRNHGVLIAGVVVCIPCGNLMATEKPNP